MIYIFSWKYNILVHKFFIQYKKSYNINSI